jgi:sulfoxide reductase heme-binding subunit YedZ
MRKRRAAKVLVFALCLVPVLWLGWRAYNSRLTANPIEYITHYTGDWTLRFVLLTLFVTPLRKVLNWPELIRYRRMLGLYAFFYGCLHFLIYLCIDKFFAWNEILEDIGKRRYITVGFLGFVLMIPLAVTSTAGWIRRMGGKRWQLLHRAVYITVIAGVIHYYWSVKSDVRLPIFYGVLATLVLGYRLIAARRRPAVAAKPRVPGIRQPVSK